MAKTTPIDSIDCQNGQYCQNVILAGAHGNIEAIRHITACDQCNVESQKLHNVAISFIEVNNLAHQAEHGNADAYQKLTTDNRLAKIWQSLSSAYC